MSRTNCRTNWAMLSPVAGGMAPPTVSSNGAPRSPGTSKENSPIGEPLANQIRAATASGSPLDCTPAPPSSLSYPIALGEEPLPASPDAPAASALLKPEDEAAASAVDAPNDKEPPSAELSPRTTAVCATLSAVVGCRCTTSEQLETSSSGRDSPRVLSAPGPAGPLVEHPAPGSC